MALRQKLEQLMRKSVRELELPEYRYEPGIPMDLNTNLIGPNPAVTRVDLASLELNHYAHPDARPLREALARFHGLSIEQVLVGRGADENLDIVVRAFVNPGERVAYPVPGFIMYPFFARVNAAEVVEVPLLNGFALDVDGMLGAGAKLAILCSPNNPTGNCLSEEAIIQVIENTPVVLIDEAYAEFSDQNFVKRIGDYENLIVNRTFSKAYGLAGIRVGYLVAGEAMVRALDRARPDYNMNSISERIAIEALNEQTFVEGYIQLVRTERERLRRDLENLGFRVYPSQANFLLARSPIDVRELVSALKRGGILIKDVSDQPGLEGCVRITIGTKELNRRLVESLRRTLQDR
ncbi:MAG: histidinol-phosphate transaminase [Candidatus Bipolaricaulia bacterium]